MYVKSVVAAVSLLLSFQAVAQAQSPDTQSTGTVPLARLIESASKKSGKKFLVDPRAIGDVRLIGQDPGSVSYVELLTILQLHGFAAVEGGGYVRIIPDANVRQAALPHVTAKENLPDAQYVTKSIEVRSMPAMSLVPALRPLLPQHAHLVAVGCGNSLIISDTMGNVKRIEDIIRSVDTGETYRAPKCDAASIPPVTRSPVRQNADDTDSRSTAPAR